MDEPLEVCRPDFKGVALFPLGKFGGVVNVPRIGNASILNGRAGISPEMAVRLSLAFGTTAESWMNQQTQHDLWHVERRRKKLRVARLSAA